MTSSENSIYGSAASSMSSSYVDTQTHQPEAEGVVRGSENTGSAGVASSAMPEEAHANADTNGADGQQTETSTTPATPGPVPTSASRGSSVAATISTRSAQAQQTTGVQVTEGGEKAGFLGWCKKKGLFCCCCCGGDEEL